MTAKPGLKLQSPLGEFKVPSAWGCIGWTITFLLACFALCLAALWLVRLEARVERIEGGGWVLDQAAPGEGLADKADAAHWRKVKGLVGEER